KRNPPEGRPRQDAQAGFRLLSRQGQAQARGAGGSGARAEIRLRRPQEQEARVPLAVDRPHQRGVPGSGHFLQRVRARPEGGGSGSEPQVAGGCRAARRWRVPPTGGSGQGRRGESVTPVEQEPFSLRESDSLGSLEERIQQTVQLVARLRQERDAALEQTAEAKAEAARMAGEIKTLQAERKQVRARIERLLGQIDQLSGGQAGMGPGGPAVGGT